MGVSSIPETPGPTGTLGLTSSISNTASSSSVTVALDALETYLRVAGVRSTIPGSSLLHNARTPPSWRSVPLPGRARVLNFGVPEPQRTSNSKSANLNLCTELFCSNSISDTEFPRTLTGDQVGRLKMEVLWCHVNSASAHDKNRKTSNSLQQDQESKSTVRLTDIDHLTQALAIENDPAHGVDSKWNR